MLSRETIRLKIISLVCKAVVNNSAENNTSPCWENFLPSHRQCIHTHITQLANCVATLGPNWTMPDGAPAFFVATKTGGDINELVAAV